jgi:tRNA threonylcarbamoyladenosine biosynthesis protein TsaB
MLTLGIDTAGRQASVALLDEDRLVGCISRPGPHSSVLLPLVAELLEDRGISPTELDLIGVSRGPGSYTGLRVGLVSAKAMGWASGTVVLGVPTLEARASLAPSWSLTVLVALHAYKKRMLYLWFDRDDVGEPLWPRGEPELVQAVEVPRAGPGQTMVTDAPELLVELDSWGSEVVSPLETAAVAAALLARRRLASGAVDEVQSLVPVYQRPPSVTLKPGVAPGAGKVKPRHGREATS